MTTNKHEPYKHVYTHDEPRPYEIKSGRPSWHQQRADHAFSGTLIASYTGSEITAFRDRLIARGEPFIITALPTLT